MDLSYHSTSLARQCPRKYKFSYIDKLRPIKVSHALSLGKIVHDAFELFYNGKSRVECLAHINKVYQQQMSEVGPEEEEDVYLNMCTAIGMFQYYPNDLLMFKDIQPEVSFSVPLENHTLIGRIDGIVTQNNKLFVREVKTTSLSHRQFAGRANRSYQTSGYIYGAVKALNRPIVGVMYDVLQKPRIYKNQSDTKETFGQRIIDLYKDKKNHKHLFNRHYSYRTEDDLSMYEQDMVELAEDIAFWKEKNRYYRNTDACWSWNKECEFAKICFVEEPDPLVMQLYFEKRKANGATQDSI